MELVKEITVFLENHPGTLAQVTRGLAERGINIRGFTLTNAMDHGALRMIVDKPSDALHVFGEHNLLALEHDVLLVRLMNEAGALSRLSEALSAAEVNVEYAYGSADTATGAPPTLFLRVSDAERALAALRSQAGVE